MKRFSFFLLIGAAALLALGGAVMLLWNAVLPEVLGVKALNYGQALGLLVLARILFGGFRGGPPRGRKPPFANPEMRQKWMKMNPDERARFREEWKKRCASPPDATDTKP